MVLVVDVAGVDPPLPGKHVEQEVGEEPEPSGCRKEVRGIGREQGEARQI